MHQMHYDFVRSNRNIKQKSKLFVQTIDLKDLLFGIIKWMSDSKSVSKGFELKRLQGGSDTILNGMGLQYLFSVISFCLMSRGLISCEQNE